MPYLFLFLLVFFVIQLIYSAYFIKYGRSKLTNQEFKRDAKLGDSNKKSLKFFVTGDSLAVGLGATTFETTVAGRVANYLTQDNFVEFKNESVSGAKMQDLLNFPKPKEKQDIIVIIVSSNDLLRLTPYRHFEDSTQKVIATYSSLCDKLIVVGPSRVSDSPVIPLFIKPIYKIRAKKYGEIIKKTSLQFKSVFYVNPHDSPHGINQVKNWASADKFHPGDDGQVYWFELIKTAI